MRRLNFQSKFFKSIALLTSGSIIAQIITFIFSPVMTRLFTPEQVGEYTLLLTVVSIFGQVVALRYDITIVTEKEQDNILPIIKLSVLLSFFVSLIISVGCAIFYVIKNITIGSVLFKSIFIFILLFLTGVTNVLISFNNRYREYKLITKVHVKRNLAKECVMTVGGLIYPNTAVLVFSQAVGIAFGVREQSKSLYENSEKFSAFKKINLAKCIKMAKRHKKQALFSTPAILANNYSYSSINIFIDSLFGESILGFYSISYRILGMPLGLISNNISKVYFEEAARLYNEKGNYRKLFLKISILLFGVAVPFSVILMLCAPSVCCFVFGKDYYLAGVYIRYLAPMFGVRLIVSPLTVGMQISEKQQKELIVQVMFIALSIIGYIIAKVLELTVTSYLLFISITFTIVYLIYYIYLFKITQSNHYNKELH